MPDAPINLGFLTVLSEPTGYLGGYLVTNSWGRPLEFRLSTAVQPGRIHQVLYGDTLRPYICADLIGKALVDKAAVGVQLLLTDIDAVLDVRARLDVPVAWIAPEGAAGSDGASWVLPPRRGRGPILVHSRFPGDSAAVTGMLAELDRSIDLTEPFARIREAIGEARKMGAMNRN